MRTLSLEPSQKVADALARELNRFQADLAEHVESSLPVALEKQLAEAKLGCVYCDSASGQWQMTYMYVRECGYQFYASVCVRVCVCVL